MFSTISMGILSTSSMDIPNISPMVKSRLLLSAEVLIACDGTSGVSYMLNIIEPCDSHSLHCCTLRLSTVVSRTYPFPLHLWQITNVGALFPEARTSSSQRLTCCPQATWKVFRLPVATNLQTSPLNSSSKFGLFLIKLPIVNKHKLHASIFLGFCGLV